METDARPAVPGTVGADVRRVHPWKQASINAEKLKAARVIASKRRSARWYAENREYGQERERNRHRMKTGVPIDLPKIKPWDWKKGKVTPNAHPHGRAPARTVQGVVGSLDQEGTR